MFASVDKGIGGDVISNILKMYRPVAIIGLHCGILPIVYLGYEFFGMIKKIDWIIISVCTVRICMSSGTLIGLIMGSTVMSTIGLMSHPIG